MSTTSTISNLNQALQCAGKCDCCQKLQNQINEFNQKLNNLENKFTTKQELNNLESYTKQGFAAVTKVLYDFYEQLNQSINNKADLQKVEFIDNEIDKIQAAIDRLQGEAGKNPGPNDASLGGLDQVKQRLNNVEIRVNNIDNKVNSTENKLNQLKIENEGQHGLIWSAIKALQVQVLALGKLFATVEMLRQTVELIKKLTDLWKPYFSKDLTSEITRLDKRIDDTFDYATRIFNRFIGVENIAKNAKSLAETALAEINFVRESALQAMLRLQRQIEALENYFNTELKFLEKSTLNALLRLQSRISIIEKLANQAINEANNAIKKAIEANSLAQSAINLARQFKLEIEAKLEQLTITLQGKINQLKAEFNTKLNQLQNTVNAKLEQLKSDLTAKINTGLLYLGILIEGIKTSLPELIKSLLPGLLTVGMLLPFVVTIINQFNNVTNRNMTIINNNNYVTNNSNVTNVTVVSQGQDLSWLRTQLNRIENIGKANLTISGIINGIVTVMNTKLGDLLPNGGISAWINRFTQWKMIDRVVSFLTFATTIHNAIQLSSNIGQTLIQAMQNVLDLFGLKDANGNEYSISDLIGRTLNNLAEGILGKQNIDNFKTQWARYSRIYQASANLFNSLLSMGDTMVNALNTISGQNAHVANALRAWGAVGENAYRWMNPEVNFGNPLLNKLQNLEETASMVEQVSAEPLNVKSAKEELENSAKELAESLEQKDNSKQSTPIPEATKIKADKEAEKTNSKAPEITDNDLEADE